MDRNNSVSRGSQRETRKVAGEPRLERLVPLKDRKFIVAKGAPAHIYFLQSPRKRSRLLKDYITKQENVFAAKELKVDPLAPQQGSDYFSQYSRDGWYGFERDGFVLLVPASRVRIE